MNGDVMVPFSGSVIIYIHIFLMSDPCPHSFLAGYESSLPTMHVSIFVDLQTNKNTCMVNAIFDLYTICFTRCGTRFANHCSACYCSFSTCQSIHKRLNYRKTTSNLHHPSSQKLFHTDLPTASIRQNT